MFQFKKLFLPIALVVCIISVSVAFILSQKHGSITVSVVDAYTNMPLENAVITVAENEASFITDKNGEAFCSGLRFVDNSKFKDLKDASTSTVTILCYKEGYMDFVLFNAEISSVGVLEKTLYMFPVGSENERTTIAMNETPNEEFSKKLLEKYKPKQFGINTQ